MKQNLFICATHGDEQFSVSIVQQLKKKYQFDWIIGNEKATKISKRYITADINRLAPGDRASDIYEMQRAAEIVELASQYKQTIDIHGTLSNCGIFIILSDPSWENIELAKKFNIEKVLLWPSFGPTGPLTQIIRPGLEIECGPKNKKKTLFKLRTILGDYLSGIKPSIKQEYYIVTGKIMGKNNPTLKDFEKTNIYGEPFYPILTDNRYPNITCYQAQKLLNTL